MMFQQKKAQEKLDHLFNPLFGIVVVYINKILIQ